MTKIAVFDSGLGSLSIIRSIQKISKSEIIYFADQKNFPYGKKSKTKLRKIIINSIDLLKKKFKPELIIVGSNTPSLLLHGLNYPSIVWVVPPLKEAAKVTKNFKIAILSTQSVVKSSELTNYIKKNKLPKKLKIIKINASPLVELVESGKFLTNPEQCNKKIKKLLSYSFEKNNVDVATLSSTHLPFLLEMLQNQFPNVKFIDPAKKVAFNVAKKIGKSSSKRNSIKIFTSFNPKRFENTLKKIGIKNKVKFLASV